MRELAEIVFLASLHAANLTLAGFGSGISSFANHLYMYWRRVAARHDAKYTVELDEDAEAEPAKIVLNVSDRGTN